MAELTERGRRTNVPFGEVSRLGRYGPKSKHLEMGIAQSIPGITNAMPYVPARTHLEEEGPLGHSVMVWSSRGEYPNLTQAAYRVEHLRQERSGSKVLSKRSTRLWSLDRQKSDAIRVCNALESERTELGFDALACRILGRIYDVGHAKSEDLESWLESVDEWIAFSRLQRARFVFDSGSEFTVSREGREFVQRILGEGVAR